MGPGFRSVAPGRKLKAMLRIVFYPDPVLTRRAEPIDPGHDGLAELAAGMLEAMHVANGVGLAAPQVAESLRLFVATDTGDPKDALVAVNPVIKPFGPPVEMEEGCLSLPDIRADIVRPEKVHMTWTGLDGKRYSGEFEDLMARIIQHEYDHLEGILFLDRMTPTDRLRIQPDLAALAEQFLPR